jgi:hypothetical protein
MTHGRTLELSWSERHNRTCLVIRGWSSAELRALRVIPAHELARSLLVLPSELVAAHATLHDLQPLSGRFEVEGDAVCFAPRFPFLEGARYSLLVRSLSGEKVAGSPQEWTIQLPSQPGTATTEIRALYPTTTEVPVNLLKFYLHFSAPMSEGWAARAVRVYRADNGAPLYDVFLALEPELWDPHHRRLTLLLDPGRIKRGLVPHREVGYPLIEGVPIVVKIDAAYRDAAGRPLRAGFERRYEVGPAVRVRIEPATWQHASPCAGAQTPLTIQFDRPLDHALLAHCLCVRDALGIPVAGEASIGKEERGWHFTPESPWKPGRYTVAVDPILEDLAGNSLLRVFDRDLTRDEDAVSYPQRAAFTFTLP